MDLTFFAELIQSRASAPPLSAEDAVEEDQEISEINMWDDDTVVPIEAMADFVHSMLPDGPDQLFSSGINSLTSRAEAEETFIKEVESILVDTTATAVKVVGRSHHKKFHNTLYTDHAFKW